MYAYPADIGEWALVPATKRTVAMVVVYFMIAIRATSN